MSRLPRLASSPTGPPPSSSLPAPSLGSTMTKRKLLTTREEMEQPRKLPALGSSTSHRPIQALRPARAPTVNSSDSNFGAARLPPPLTKPRAPTLATAATKRAASAPPKAIPGAQASTTNVTARRPTTRSTMRAAGAAASTNAGNSTNTESRLTSLESAVAASKAQFEASMAAERAKFAELQAVHTSITRQLAATNTASITHRKELDTKADEFEAARRRFKAELEELESELRRKERKEREVTEDLRVVRDDLDREREVVSKLKSTISQQSTAHLTLATRNETLQAQNTVVQAERDAAYQENVRLRHELDDAMQRIANLELEARDAEGHRRKLHNMVQELKGNIRVFCRVRPILPSEEEDGAGWVFPDTRDHREIVVSSSTESATGQERKEVHNFGFDRVFEPQASQAEVFEEVSQLAQSCTDGYNVCIFAYGQTGSGKSYTMEGGDSEETSGMIPRAVEQVFRVTEELKTKGWEYKMEGQFLEIYNETINDLLGKHDFDKKKHEIRHEKSPLTGAPTTRVTDVTVHALSSPSQVRALLALAQSRRTVASTLMNDRSSRSHSVFTLRISGYNASGNGGAGERCEGSLNLVDLAGSERLKEVGHGQSAGAAKEGDKERLKETQNINRSLSALGDVIAALGEAGRGGGAAGEKHIPYRNSKLTYLLQHSLSGNSKTLMVLNLSPMAAHLNESLTSLRFATKVNSTTLGTAKKQSK